MQLASEMIANEDEDLEVQFHVATNPYPLDDDDQDAPTEDSRFDESDDEAMLEYVQSDRNKSYSDYWNESADHYATG